MAERKLPAVFLPTVDGFVFNHGTYHFERRVDIRSATGELLGGVEYIPRPVVCKDCKYHRQLPPPSNPQTRYCEHPFGLRAPLQDDGLSSCSYAEPKEARGE